MNNTQLSLANRKQLADVLSDNYRDGNLRRKAKQVFSAKKQELRDKLILEYAKRAKATNLIDEISDAEAELEELNQRLLGLGFVTNSHGEILLADSAERLQVTIDNLVEKELGTSAAIDARFDSAMIAMMTVANLQEAQQILKSVQELT